MRKKVLVLLLLGIMATVTEAQDRFLIINCGDFIHVDIYRIEIKQSAQNKFRPSITYEIFIDKISYLKRTRAEVDVEAENVVQAYITSLKKFTVFAYYLAEQIKERDKNVQALIDDLYRILNKRYPWKVKKFKKAQDKMI